MFTLEKLVPEVIICDGAYVPVRKVIAHPPTTDRKAPIVAELTAVEVITDRGSRWFGTTRAWIGADLRMHMLVNPRNEVLRGWEDPAE